MNRPLLRVLSGFSVNMGAAHVATAFIGIAFPRNSNDFFVLISNILFGTMFLYFSYLYEKELEKYG